MLIAWIAAQVQIRYGATLPVFMHAPAHRFKLWVNERRAADQSWLRRFSLRETRQDEARSRDTALRRIPLR